MAARARGSVTRARLGSGRVVAPARPARAGRPGRLAVAAAGGGAGGDTRSVRVVELQRSRLLAAAVAAFDELGYVRTTVADVTGRARVSRRTFYEQFANGDACLAAVLDDAVAVVELELAAVGLAGRPWCERVRGGLQAMLAFLDREPALARVCLVQAARGGAALLERRERLLARLVVAVDEGRADRMRGVNPSPLTAEGVVGAALTIVQARVARRDARALTDLLNELTAMIVLPYRGPAAARRELARPLPAAPAPAAAAPLVADPFAEDPLEGVTMRLTYRTVRVLEVVAGWPGASNRQVAERAGVHDPGQISKLLTRLQRLGLLRNGSAGHVKGEPNAWRLTSLGERVTERLALKLGEEGGVA